ncbi:MAG: ComEC/Rec2 family competence protein [Planctomycetota bacterium]
MSWIPNGWLKTPTWHQRQPALPFATAAVTGVAIDQFCDPEMLLWAGSSAIGFIVTSVALLRRRNVAARGAMVQAPFLCLFLAVFGWWHAVAVSDYDSATINQFVTEEEQPAVVTGQVAELPRQRRTRLVRERRTSSEADVGLQTIFVIELDSIRHGYEDRPVTGRILAMVDGDRPEHRIGDRLKLFGTLSTFASPSNPGQVDRRSWARRRGVHAVMEVSTMHAETDSAHHSSRVSRSWSVAIQRGFGELARSGRVTLLDHVGKQQGPLAMALVLGQRDLLEPALRDRLLVTGTAHLLSVSGLHLAIIVWMVRVIACATTGSIRTQIIVMCLAAAFYVALTGGRPPVLRSAILLASLLASLVIGRSHEPINALSMAAIVLTLLIPTAIFSIGVLLSFIAVATLLHCGQQSSSRARTPAAHAIELETRMDDLARQSDHRWLRWARWTAKLVRDSTLYSLCVFMMTFPLVWHEFHVVSFASVIVNLIVSGLMVVALASGALTVLAGWLFGGLAAFPGYICQGTLALMDWLLKQFEQLPLGHVWWPSPPWWMVILFYAVVLLCVAFVDGKYRARLILLWTIVWMATAWLIATTPTALPKGTLEITFVNVGHGTATIIRDDSQSASLYDCGWIGNSMGNSQPINGTLWSMGLTTVETIYLSHADADHFNALPSLARRFGIGGVVTPSGMLGEQEPALEPVRDAIARHDIPVTEWSRKTTLPGPLHVIHPPKRRLEGSDNANSLVLRWDHGGRSVILPGDLEPPGNREVMNQPRPIAGGVLMAPHHGSVQKGADQIIQWARPSLTVVSGGRRSTRDEVIAMMTAAGGQVMITHRDGAVRVRLHDKGAIQVQAWRDTPW